jgi:3-dehydroquinate dehydratase/shikimate dehydrogenase
VPTRLCVAIFVTDEATARRDIAVAAERGADFIELRLDTFDRDPSNLIDHSIIPAIITNRPAWEGGRSTESDEARFAKIAFVAYLARGGADVELETWRRLRFDRTDLSRLILSVHDFEGRPARLMSLVQELYDSFADAVKIVWTARTIRDNLEAFDILKLQQKPTIALCMGEAGLISRVLAKKFNAFVTFASLDNSAGTAPGQVSVTDMKRLYRWDAINPATKVFGVVGSPVAHSMSPAVHNAAFDATGFDGVYLPMLVNPGYESFKAFIESFLHFDGLDLSGLSVTIPHKENALRYLKENGAAIDPVAERVGAVNTIVIGPDGTLRGLNTDYSAIVDLVGDVKGKRVVVLGAGGTGRTAVAALAAGGATVVVYNRTRDRADAVAAEFNGTPGKVVAADWAKLCDSCCQVYVNTTPIGMFPKIDESPIADITGFDDQTRVVDVIYNPPETRLIKQARAAGATAVGGVEMFVAQAAGQFTAWTSLPAPVDTMRDALVGRLK